MFGCLGSPRSVHREFWRAIARGLSSQAAAAAAGVSPNTAWAWFRDHGGMSPLDLGEPSGRYLCLAEREEIALARAGGVGVREIARRLGRHPSTISRELRRNLPKRRGERVYRATLAQARAEQRARRPKISKLVAHPRLREVVQAMLEKHMSPEQIAGRLPREFPDDASMRISTEAIYQALYIQPRGHLRRELTACLRTGRALRKPRRRADARRAQQSTMVMIADRPADVQDRLVPGDWEGDLITGTQNKSAIGVLVERTTRYTKLLPLPDGHGAEQVQAAIIAAMARLPDHLRRSLTWDQGSEMANHAQIAIDAQLAVYFCDPHSPWQRPTGENTNGLLRQYFPKGTDLSIYTAVYIQAVEDEFNDRPRKILNFRTPAEAMASLLATAGVATTA
jgi:transposase, IS30 family